MALPLIVAGVAARAAAKKVATTVAKKSAAKAKSNTVVKKVSKGIENQKFKKIKEESNDFYKIARAVGRGEDPVKAAKALNKKLSKGTIKSLETAKLGDAPLLSRSQLTQISAKSKISPKAIAENISKKKYKTKVGTPSSVKTKDGVFTVSKTPTGKVKVTDPKGKSTKLPRGKTAQSYFTNQRPR
jgi:hypothetical protein